MAYPVSPSQTGRKASVAAMNLHDDDTRIVLTDIRHKLK